MNLRLDMTDWAMGIVQETEIWPYEEMVKVQSVIYPG